ncbi:unnamed protein product, partial [Heterosigma akashiwo]
RRAALCAEQAGPLEGLPGPGRGGGRPGRPAGLVRPPRDAGGAGTRRRVRPGRGLAGRGAGGGALRPGRHQPGHRPAHQRQGQVLAEGAGVHGRSGGARRAAHLLP